MNKKIRSLICFALIVTISMPVVSMAFAGKPDKGTLEKKVFIHYKKGYGKPEDTPGVGPEPDDEGYYELLVKGAKLTPTETIIINPEGSNLDHSEVRRIIELSAEEWDAGAYSTDWDGVNVDLFDGYSIDYEADWDSDGPDGDNEISFGNYDRVGVIAVCIVWGRFGGPPSGRYIQEFDIMFDTDYEWSLSGEPGKMDLQNIATHEFGHGLGLGDLYHRKTTSETMYGYSHYGDIVKRDLYFGDIAGIQELYGE